MAAGAEESPRGPGGTKELLRPALLVTGPDCRPARIDLAHDRITVGRLPGLNDVVLEPDPQRYVSARWHCLVELDQTTWRVVDNGSTNGTFLRRDGVLSEVRGAEPLADGDVICVLASLADDGEPTYWELAFSNPYETVPVASRSRAARLEYDWLQAKLYRITGAKREEIQGLRPQVHQLLRYLLKRNRANDDVAVLCSYPELMDAIWEGEPLHTREELAGLVHELRRRIELEPSEPRFVQTVRGLGLRLDPRPPAD